MATILLSAAGAAIGGGFGGTVLGLSGAVIGRAVGATLGRVIDQRLLGSGSHAVETGKIDRFRLSGAGEGAPVGDVWGRMRVSGQVIWASRFLEQTQTSGGGKGAPPTPKTTQFSYSVSLAIALCEGEIARVGRVWADGVEIAPSSVTMRVYSGSETQLPDPKMEAIEGAGKVPAYRGTAYVVFEDLALGPYGNRVPQFSFEVIRPAQGAFVDSVADLTQGIRGVALIPGTGEYALATTPVHYSYGVGQNVSANIHNPAEVTDMTLSLTALAEELPGCESVSMVVSWFGDDLRAGQCTVRPKVEDGDFDGIPIAWRAGGIGRAQAEEVAQVSGRPIYGGTPADEAVVEAIAALHAQGKAVMFYPFILMEQVAGNSLPDPWTGAVGQPQMPWRGRITLSVAPGRAGTPDRTATAASEVAAFFGSAQASDFSTTGGQITYAGPNEWSYRRFVLHYAKLCALAGGVEAFCIGSEMRGLTQIRGAGDSFPAVTALKQLAADVRGILGAGTKISYAADWSEFARYDDGAGNVYFPLDPLWSDANIDAVGIDNYFPIADWRDGDDHADADWGAVYNLQYLQSNIQGGEYYDWYYGSPEERLAQRRTPITDGAYSEPWVFRQKDIRGWWENAHHERIGGVRQTGATAWVPQSKPVWFTEFGCAAIDKGANEPNKFLDSLSSESSLPAFSNGRRDELMQMQYLRAMIGYWGDAANNPTSEIYAGAMVDMTRAHVWAWDARPFPYFPSNTTVWADGGNYARGHWMNGRTTAQPLASVVAEICGRAGIENVDVTGLYGIVRGYLVGDNGSGRQALQPLMIAYGFEALERDGTLVFRMRDGRVSADIGAEQLAVGESGTGFVETMRASAAEIAGRVRLSFVEAEGDYETRVTEATFPDDDPRTISHSELALSLTRAEGQRIVERWLSEARVARDGARLTLPPSLGYLGAGDVIRVAQGPAGAYRIDRVEQAGALAIEAVRIEEGVYEPSDEADERVTPRSFAAPVPVASQFLDLPLMTGSEVPYAPHLAVTATPWPGSAAAYSSDQDAGYALNLQIAARAVMGLTRSTLDAAQHGLWDRGVALRVQISGGQLASASEDQVLNGANLMAIGDGSSGNWELFQFRDAQLVASDTYDLSVRLRGQAGTDAYIPTSWPVGSVVVLMDGAPKQISVTSGERDLARHYRIGPAARAYDDPSYTHTVQAFSGIGLRPLSVCHLQAVRATSGDYLVNWIRRTRTDGDSWSAVEVPLGELREVYVVRIVQNSTIKREETVATPAYVYAQALQVLDGVDMQVFEIHVAQLSDAFGPGPFTRMVIND